MSVHMRGYTIIIHSLFSFILINIFIIIIFFFIIIIFFYLFFNFFFFILIN